MLRGLGSSLAATSGYVVLDPPRCAVCRRAVARPSPRPSSAARRYTDGGTPITSVKELDAELDRIAEQGYAIDDEEYLPGLVCIAVLVPGGSERSNLCVATQAPVLRIDKDSATKLLPALRRAAAALADIEREGNQ